MKYEIDKQYLIENFLGSAIDKIKNTDLNSARDHLVNNFGMLAGAGLGGYFLGSSVYDVPEASGGHNLANAGLAAGIGATAGGTIGHFAQKQLSKKDNQNPSDYNYKF